MDSPRIKGTRQGNKTTTPSIFDQLDVATSTFQTFHVDNALHVIDDMPRNFS